MNICIVRRSSCLLAKLISYFILQEKYFRFRDNLRHRLNNIFLFPHYLMHLSPLGYAFRKNVKSALSYADKVYKSQIYYYYIISYMVLSSFPKCNIYYMLIMLHTGGTSKKIKSNRQN